MAKLNKNLIIQLLTDEVERLKSVNKDANDELDCMYDTHRDLNQLNDQLVQEKMDLIAQCDDLRDQLSRAEDARTKAEEQHEEYNNDYYSTESIAIRRAEEAERKLARARITFDELELLMTPCSIHGEKIKAIKVVRQITGAGLKESKELVEHYNRAYEDRIERILRA